MGGVIGHIQHPYENLKLTFHDLYDLIMFITDSQYTGDNHVIYRLEAIEKLDGQQLSISWRDDKGLMVARNKGHLKNFGDLSMSYNDLELKFKDHICGQAFCDAYNDLNVIISGLTDEQRHKIFKNGKKWISLEIINPLTTNIITYNQKTIVFHYAVEYDENGNFVKLYENDGQKLDDAIQFGRKSKIGTYTFLPPQHVKTANISKWSMRFYNQIKKIMNQYNINTNDTIGEYLERHFLDILMKNINLTPISNSSEVVGKILRRFVYGDKSFTLPQIKKVNVDLANWVKIYEKYELKFEFKYARRYLEKCFLELGSLLLYHTPAINFLSKEIPDATGLLNRLDDTINKINITDRKLNHQVNLLKEINDCVPGNVLITEGIVFRFKDKLYKLTGRFAPINQILGELRF